MKIKLLRDAPVRTVKKDQLEDFKKGDIADAHPIDANHLVANGVAELVIEKKASDAAK